MSRAPYKPAKEGGGEGEGGAAHGYLIHPIAHKFWIGFGNQGRCYV